MKYAPHSMEKTAHAQELAEKLNLHVSYLPSNHYYVVWADNFKKGIDA